MAATTTDPATHRTRARSRTPARSSVELYAGVATVTAGVLVLAVRWSLSDLAVIIGVTFLVRGIADLVSSAVAPSPVMTIVLGLSGLGVGTLAIAWTTPTTFVVATVAGVWLITSGLLTLIGALNTAPAKVARLSVIAGLGSIGLGVWALAHPSATVSVLAAVVGIWAIVGGLTLVGDAMEAEPVLVDLRDHPAPNDHTTARTTPTMTS